MSDININKLIDFHKKHKKLATVTIVKPSGKFGAISLSGDNVKKFQEKPDGDGNWISGGFFVLDKSVLSYIDDDETIWEKKPLENLVKNRQLKAYKHKGFWASMDTLNDKNKLEKMWLLKKFHGKHGMNNLKNFWKGKKVFITGHTGFKGSWLLLTLKELGAVIAGYSLPPIKDGIFDKLKLNKSVKFNHYKNILDYKFLNSSIKNFRPDIIFSFSCSAISIRVI